MNLPLYFVHHLLLAACIVRFLYYVIELSFMAAIEKMADGWLSNEPLAPRGEEAPREPSLYVTCVKSNIFSSSIDWFISRIDPLKSRFRPCHPVTSI